MKLRLRFSFALLAALAAAASAQETQQDLAARIVKEQEDLRRSQLEQVMSAHARAVDGVGNNAYTNVRLDEVGGKSEPAPAPAKPWRPPERGGSTILILLACALPVVPLMLLGFAYWRKWRFEDR